MSDKLAISSAFSVLLMASYVLFGGDARQIELLPQHSLLTRTESPAPLSQVLLPQVSVLLPR